MADLPTYVLERTFDAPREMVWRTWTEPELVARWYGPNVETIVHQMDVEPGGLWLVEMRMRGASSYQRAEYLEVEAPKRLVWLHSNADAGWKIAPSPMMKDWPRTLLTTVTFDQLGQQTKLRLTWVPHDASDAEVECFRAAISGMDLGWAAGMEILRQLLAEMRQQI